MTLYPKSREYELSVLVAEITNATVMREHNLGIIHEQFATAKAKACEKYTEAILDIDEYEAGTEANRQHALRKEESDALADEVFAKLGREYDGLDKFREHTAGENIRLGRRPYTEADAVRDRAMNFPS